MTKSERAIITWYVVGCNVKFIVPSKYCADKFIFLHTLRRGVTVIEAKGGKCLLPVFALNACRAPY